MKRGGAVNHSRIVFEDPQAELDFKVEERRPSTIEAMHPAIGGRAPFVVYLLDPKYYVKRVIKMKRIKFLLVALVLALSLSACRVEPEEIPFDPEAVEVKLLKNGKELSEQELVENQIEGHVTTINLSVSDNLPEDITPKIVWTRNLIPLVEGREYSYTPVQGLLSKTDIFATLSFTYEDKEYSIQTETFTVKVLGRQATIVIDTIHPDLNEAIVNYIIKENATKIDFNASVAGDYSVSDLVWWAVDEETLQQTKIGQGVANISYTPTSSGL